MSKESIDQSEVKPIHRKCLENDDVKTSWNNLETAIKNKDNLGVLTSLMSMQIAIDRVFVKADKPLFADDVGTIFNQFPKFTTEEYRYIATLQEVIPSFFTKMNQNPAQYQDDPALRLIPSKGEEFHETSEDGTFLYHPDGSPLMRSKDDEEYREYLFFLLNNTSKIHQLFTNETVDIQQPDEKTINIVHNQLAALAQVIYNEIGDMTKKEFNEKYADKSPQAITETFKTNAEAAETKRQSAIAEQKEQLKEGRAFLKDTTAIFHMFGEEISLNRKDFKIEGKLSSYQQEFDKRVKAIFAQPFYSENADVRREFMSACVELKNTTGYEPRGLNEKELRDYNFFFAKTAIKNIITESKIRNVDNPDIQQINRLDYNERRLEKAQRLEEIIAAATNLADKYEKRGGFYTIPNMIFDAINKFLGKEPSKSNTSRELLAAVAEIKKLIPKAPVPDKENTQDPQPEADSVMTRRIN